MRSNPLTINETNLLRDVLDEFEKQFDEDQGAEASVEDSDSEEYIDIAVDFKDGTSESFALERDKLSQGLSVKKIAQWIS